MKIAVIGGGPAGLYFSLLAKKGNPAHEIDVYEQNPDGATYGWGVVFSNVGLAFLEEADPEFFREFTAHHEKCNYMEIVHRGNHVQVHGNHFSRTSRIDMLKILQRACQRIGVRIHFGSRIEDVSALAKDVDLLIGADGANSSVRTQLAAAFQPSFEKRPNHFAWYGTRQRFHPVSLIFKGTPYGVFIAHSYQYSADLSTFLVEVDPTTWRRAGLDQLGEDESLDFCTKIFREELGGNELLANRSPWFQVNILRNQNWTHQNVVLLGDALRTVHFSLGSGTRMAMQDAIALHEGILAHPHSLSDAFNAFEARRRPASSNFQAAAEKSLQWYENVQDKMHLDPVAFAYDYMRRTGQVSHDDLRRRDPHFIDSWESAQLPPSASQRVTIISPQKTTMKETSP